MEQAQEIRFPINERKTTSKKASIGFSIFLSIVALGLIWSIHAFLLPAQPLQESTTQYFTITGFRTKLFESGPIPFAILFTFLFGLSHLFQIVQNQIPPKNLYDSEFKALLQQIRNTGPFALLMTAALLEKSGKKDYLYLRVRKVLDRWMVDQDLDSLIAFSEQMFERDEEEIAIAFVPVVFSEWCLPLLGFLGTVVGIAGAIGGVQEGVNLLIVRGELDQTVTSQLGAGFKGLSLAFDTTFLGLVGLVIVGGIQFYLRREISQRLSTIRESIGDLISSLKDKGVTPCR